MSGHHHHGPVNANAAVLTKALMLTGTFLGIEVVGGILTGSLALISDAAHMLTDTVGLAIALAGIKIGQRPADTRRTFGYQRFEILAAAFNAVMLFGVALYILYEGYRRFVEPQPIQTWGMLLIAVAGLVVNLLSMRLLRAGKDSSLNVKGAYLEVWSDMLGSLGVIAAGTIIAATSWTWVDPLVAIGIGIWVLPRTWTLLRETTNILLEGAPDGVDVEGVAAALKATTGVQDIHDLHVWAISGDLPSLSAHVVVADGHDGEDVRLAAQSVLVERFNILHVTLQTERQDCRLARPHHGLH